MVCLQLWPMKSIAISLSLMAASPKSIAISLAAFQPLDPVDFLAKGWLPLKTIDTPIESIGCLFKTIYHFYHFTKIYHG